MNKRKTLLLALTAGGLLVWFLWLLSADQEQSEALTLQQLGVPSLSEAPHLVVVSADGEADSLIRMGDTWNYRSEVADQQAVAAIASVLAEARLSPVPAPSEEEDRIWSLFFEGKEIRVYTNDMPHQDRILVDDQWYALSLAGESSPLLQRLDKQRSWYSPRLFEGDLRLFSRMGVDYPQSPGDSVAVYLRQGQVVIPGVQRPDSARVNGFIYGLATLQAMDYVAAPATGRDSLLAVLTMDHLQLGRAVEVHLLPPDAQGRFVAWLPQRKSYAVLDPRPLAGVLVTQSDLEAKEPAGP